MGRTTITGVKVRKILDGSGNQTLEVEIVTESAVGRASPSFAHQRTRGKYEVIHYPEGGIAQSIKLIKEEIAPKIIGMDCLHQEAIDKLLKELDGTPNLSSLGGNTIEAVSTAVAHGAAASLGIPLYLYMGGPFSTEIPHPMVNIIGGGPTAGTEDWRGRTPDFQEHNIIVVGAKNVFEAMTTAIEVHHEVGSILAKKVPSFGGGKDLEYSWLPNITDKEALDILREGVHRVQDRRGIQIVTGIDAAASDMWLSEKGTYYYQREETYRTKSEQLDFIGKLIDEYNLYYIEDAFHEDDIESYVTLTKAFGGKCLIVADDFFGGQMNRLLQGIQAGATNCVVVKVNMIGTLTDAYRFSQKTKMSGCSTIISPRVGDTCDTTTAHLGLAWHANLIKTVGAVGGERLAKINEFVRIDEELKNRTRLATLPWLTE
jgi:enolase